MYNILLFDLDGTLTDSAPGIFNSVKFALNAMGREIPDAAKLNKFVGPPLLYSFQEYCGMNADEAAEAVRQYRIYYPEKGIFESIVYDGIPELLQELKGSGKKIVLATAKPEKYSLRILEHFDLMKYFDLVYGASLDKSRDTKDAVIAAVLEGLGNINKDEVVMIGDRHHDIEGAKVNGIKSIGVLYGYGDLEELETAGADHIAAEVKNIIEFV